MFVMNDDFLEYEKDSKLLKSINLDDFSIEDLNNYTDQLNSEIKRVKLEKDKKIKSQNEAKKYFK